MLDQKYRQKIIIKQSYDECQERRIAKFSRVWATFGGV